MSREVTGSTLSDVATISANNDVPLGELISEAYSAAGVNGDVIMKDSIDETTFSSIKSQYWRTNTEKETAELENPFVLLLTSPLNNIRKIQNILEHCIKQNRPLLIIGELEQQPLATLLSNKVKGVIKVNVIDCPGFGKTKQDTVDDVSFRTGATPISEALGDDFDFIDISFLGEVDQVVTDSMRTVIQVPEVEGTEERIQSVRDKIKNEENPYIKKKLEERINILAGAVSIINVGAESKIELKEKKDRIEDAMYAVKAAIKEGIVPGGGIALLNASYAIEGTVLAKAIQAPFKTILANADILLSDPVLGQLQNSPGTGLDVISGEIVNMVEAGIIDPVLVTKTALKNAVSVITTIISTDAILSNKIKS
jgi:chaperonin GroEL